VNEFSIIDKYFNWNTDNSISVGIGDDCAVIDIDSDYQIVTSVDTLIEDVHFSSLDSPADIAYKSLSVNLSDIAAMGGIAKYFTLAISLPDINEKWLEGFANSLKIIANKYKIELVGGDTTKGQLSITINVTGVVERDKVLLRSNAKPGDLIFVSNTLGDAAYALKQKQNNQSAPSRCIDRLNKPEPRIELGRSLVGIANSCIDISDGLEQDLGHILDSSGVGAIIDIDSLPLSETLREYIDSTGDWCIALAGGDDYELCFSVDQSNKESLSLIQSQLNIELTQIGVVTQEVGLVINGFSGECSSYRHF
jgi:thiamine-monophosphate kinase